MTNIPNYAFRNSSNMTGDLIIPNSVISMGKYAFANSSGHNVFTGKNLTSIPNYTFAGSTFNGTLLFGDALVSIGERAFSDCNSFTGDLVIPNAVTSMGQYAFSRIVSEDGDGRLGYWGGQALSGRTYTNEMFNDLSDVQKFWGVGFGHGSDVLGNYYRNSWTSHLVACGYLSIPVWLVIVSSVFLRGDMRFKVFAVIFALLYCISASATVTGFSYFFSFLLSGCTLPPPHRETER